MRILGSKIVGCLKKWLLGTRNTRASCSVHEVSSHRLIFGHDVHHRSFDTIASHRKCSCYRIRQGRISAQFGLLKFSLLLVLITHDHRWICPVVSNWRLSKRLSFASETYPFLRAKCGRMYEVDQLNVIRYPTLTTGIKYQASIMVWRKRTQL